MAAQRRFVAATIARLPAALNFRFSLRGVGAATADIFDPASRRVLAHRFRWAAAILARTAADIPRLFLVGGAPFGEVPPNICRSSAIRASIRLFCSIKPSMAAVTTALLNLVGI
jgi:hypothetical protein